jgi:hypothetical protein
MLQANSRYFPLGKRPRNPKLYRTRGHMKTLGPGLVIALSLPFLTSCFTTLSLPVPEPAERGDTNVRGVVLGEGENSERVEFDQIDDVQWTEESLIITGIAKNSDRPGVPQATAFSLEDASAILIRSLDPNRTSGIIAALFLIPISIWMVAINGQSSAKSPGADREGCQIIKC